MQRLVLFLLLTLAMPFFVHAETPEERRIRLQAELQQVEIDITQKKGVLSEKQKERASLERDIAVITGQINLAKSQIKQRDVVIRKLEDDIYDKLSAISSVDKTVATNEESLAQILRRIREVDDTSLVSLALSDSVSAVFEDIDTFEKLQTGLRESFSKLETLRSDLKTRKESLEEKQSEQEEMRKLQLLEKQAIERREREKKSILTVTRGEERNYQKLLADKVKQAAQIRAALFDLRDTGAVSFEKILGYAKEASAVTGVRPALILGILKEETNLGKNVGTGNWKVDMKSPRDTEPFKEITAELGLDPDTVKVSRKPSYGWGGAMGPAQFIPSTWMLYKKRIAEITGQNPPNPWDARTATFATALLMKDNGANKGTRAAERLAALRYLAGWGNASKPAYAFYGDDVMEFADEFQKQIDILGE
jgi:membrane-bound lytic murein transglycosylase B